MRCSIKKELIVEEKWGLVDRAFRMAREKGFSGLPKFSSDEDNLYIDFS